MTNSIRTLIDGYNLLFQSNFVGRSRGPGWLERSRNRLLQFLQTHLPERELSATHIVFDATQSALSSRGETTDERLTEFSFSISFAREHSEADDLLEEIIVRHFHPKSLLVVSSDHRVQRRARARRATTIDSEAFLERLQRQGLADREHAADIDIERSPDDRIPDEKEVEYWLRRFVDE